MLFRADAFTKTESNEEKVESSPFQQSAFKNRDGEKIAAKSDIFKFILNY